MKYIPFRAVCPLASCTRSNTCARYAQYVKSLAEDDTFEVLNVKHMNLEGESCLLAIFESHGADMNLGFDGYEEVEVLVER